MSTLQRLYRDRGANFLHYFTIICFGIIGALGLNHAPSISLPPLAASTRDHLRRVLRSAETKVRSDSDRSGAETLASFVGIVERGDPFVPEGIAKCSAGGFKIWWTCEACRGEGSEETNDTVSCEPSADAEMSMCGGVSPPRSHCRPLPNAL